MSLIVIKLLKIEKILYNATLARCFITINDI